MKTDNYLKIILTVIAVALVILIFQNAHIVGNVNASSPSGRNYALVPVNSDGTISVRMKSPLDVMDVNIKQVGGSSISDALPTMYKSGTFDVNIKELGGSTIYDGIPIFSKGKTLDVNIDQVAGFKVYGKIPVESN